MSTGYTIYLRNKENQRVALLDDYQRAELRPRFNDVGSWEIQVNRGLSNAVPLTTPGFGIEVVRDIDGQAVISGPNVTRRHHREMDDQGNVTNTVTVYGVDDNVWLKRRLAHPQPASAAPPYSTTEHDVRTGTCSSVLRQYVDHNLGASALSVRRVTGLTLASDPVIGSTVTGRARWQTVLELLQGLALSGGGIGFRIRQSGTSLEFQAYQPGNPTAVFAEELGNLAGFEYESTAPEANYIVCGGSGEGTARAIKEGQDSVFVTVWGRIEKFADRRDTTDAGELGQEITEQLEENQESADLSITPIDIEGMSYGTHYDLGDSVIVIADAEIHERIREVRIVLTPDGPQATTPVIGTPGRLDIFRMFRVFRKQEKRLTNLERR